MVKLLEMNWTHHGQKQRRAQEKDGMNLRLNWTIVRWINAKAVTEIHTTSGVAIGDR